MPLCLISQRSETSSWQLGFTKLKISTKGAESGEIGWLFCSAISKSRNNGPSVFVIFALCQSPDKSRIKALSCLSQVLDGSCHIPSNYVEAGDRSDNYLLLFIITRSYSLYKMVWGETAQGYKKTCATTCVLSPQAHEKCVVAHGAVLGQVLLVKVHQELFRLESKLLVHDLVSVDQTKIHQSCSPSSYSPTCVRIKHPFFLLQTSTWYSPWQDYLH